jgi:hypothetical protein
MKAISTSSGEADPDTKDAFISHASEDKATVAEPLAQALSSEGWNVWLDKLELTVGDSLNQRINNALARSRFGIVVLSEAFFSKHWPQRELDALTARETVSGQKVILPVWHGIDTAYLAEVSPTLADRVGVSTEHGLESVARELIRALEQARTAPHDPNRKEPVIVSVNRVPRNADEQQELLDARPPGWEYLWFARVLLVGKDGLEVKWRDHELRIGRGPREHFDDELAALGYLRHSTDDMAHAIGPINRVLAPEAQAEAFGAPGEPGDPARIEHVGHAVVRAYEALLDAAGGLRQQAVPSSLEHAFELAAQLANNAVAEIRDFIDRTVAETDRIPAYIADPSPDKPRLEIHLDLTLSVDQDVQDQLSTELARLRGEAG